MIPCIKMYRTGNILVFRSKSKGMDLACTRYTLVMNSIYTSILQWIFFLPLVYESHSVDMLSWHRTNAFVAWRENKTLRSFIAVQRSLIKFCPNTSSCMLLLYEKQKKILCGRMEESAQSYDTEKITSCALEKQFNFGACEIEKKKKYK